MKVKILGAQIIGFGIIMLALGMVGMRLNIFWFLDAFGPKMAVVLKLGFIALGVWVWRLADSSPAVEEDVTEEESKRAWMPVGIAGTLIVGIIVFVTSKTVRDSHLEKQISVGPPRAEWAGDPARFWPEITLVQKAKFVHHSTLEAGCACLVRLPTGEICALTAGHLLGQAGGVMPGFTHGGLGGLDKDELAKLESEVVSWKLFLPDDEDHSVNVTGLYGKANQLDEQCDQVLLSLAPGTNNYPVTPLDIRVTPVMAGETLRLLTYSTDDSGERQQVVHDAHRVPGMGFTCMMDKPAYLNGFSGSPIVDTNGLLVGILTGGSMIDMNNPSGYARSFTGHLISELMPVLKDAVAQKGTAKLMPIKGVDRATVKTDTKTQVLPVRDTI